MKFFVLICTTLLFFTFSAHAGERIIESGGQAVLSDDFKAETEIPYVDIYHRTIQYKEANAAFRDNLERRRDHYNDARNQVIQDYKRDLKNSQSSSSR